MHLNLFFYCWGWRLSGSVEKQFLSARPTLQQVRAKAQEANKYTSQHRKHKSEQDVHCLKGHGKKGEKFLQECQTWHIQFIDVHSLYQFFIVQILQVVKFQSSFSSPMCYACFACCSQNPHRGTSGPSRLRRKHLPGTSKRHGGLGEKPRIDFHEKENSKQRILRFFLQTCFTVSSWSHIGFMKNGINCQNEFPPQFHACLKAAESLAFKNDFFGLWHSRLTQAGEDDTLVHARPRRSAFLCTFVGINKMDPLR